MRPETEFQADQYARVYPDGIQNHWWHLARNRIVYDELIRFGGASSPVLDVGCGRGIAVQYLAARGVDCHGVELGLAPPLAGIGHRIRPGLEAAALPLEDRSRYETILLLDVIEHLPDPPPFLATLAQDFEHLARLIVTVPAGPELWSNYDEFYGHHRRYTASMLNELAEVMGWDLVHQSHFFRPLYLPMWAMSHFGKPRSTQVEAPIGAARWVHQLVAGALIADAKMLPGSFPGTSLIACFNL